MDGGCGGVWFYCHLKSVYCSHGNALIVCVWQYMVEGHTHLYGYAMFVYHLSVCCLCTVCSNNGFKRQNPQVNVLWKFVHTMYYGILNLSMCSSSARVTVSAH